MSINEGFNRYRCDVVQCGKEAYALPQTDIADSYAVRRRIDADGMERTLVLCPEHAESYASLVNICETAYESFENDGTVNMPSREEVDALTAQLETALDNLKQMTKSRDTWWANAKNWEDRYNALAEEFEAYKKAHPENGGE